MYARQISCLEGVPLPESSALRCIHSSKFGTQTIRKMSRAMMPLNRERQARQPRTTRYLCDRGPVLCDSLRSRQGIILSKKIARLRSTAIPRILIMVPIGDHFMKMYHWLTLSGAQKMPRIAELKNSCTISVTGTRNTRTPCMGFDRRVTRTQRMRSGTSNALGSRPEPSVGELKASPWKSRTKPPAFRCIRQMHLATTLRYQSSSFSPHSFGSARAWEQNEEAM
mmetsp:Transcript_8782/g.25921  ORF Transcript_8782/g.25921 Transcript_8782/m.25921 type:complete len:225 (-) Transcript_8782:430-1104(-)